MVAKFAKILAGVITLISLLYTTSICDWTFSNKRKKLTTYTQQKIKKRGIQAR